MTQSWGRGDEGGASSARVCACMLEYVCRGMCGYRNRREVRVSAKKKTTALLLMGIRDSLFWSHSWLWGHRFRLP